MTCGSGTLVAVPTGKPHISSWGLRHSVAPGQGTCPKAKFLVIDDKNGGSELLPLPVTEEQDASPPCGLG